MGMASLLAMSSAIDVLSSSLGMPMVLAHAEVITVGAMLLTLMGNLLVYGSMIAYAIVFKEEGDW